MASNLLQLTRYSALQGCNQTHDITTIPGEVLQVYEPSVEACLHRKRARGWTDISADKIAFLRCLRLFPHSRAVPEAAVVAAWRGISADCNNEDAVLSHLADAGIIQRSTQAQLVSSTSTLQPRRRVQPVCVYVTNFAMSSRPAHRSAHDSVHAWQLSLCWCHGLQQSTAKQVLAGTKPLRTITFHALLVEYLAAHQTTYSAPPAPATSIQLQLNNGVLHPPLSQELCAQLVSQAAVTLFGTTSACDDSGWQLTPTAVPGWHAYLVTALANWPRPAQAIAGAALLQRAVDEDGGIADAACALLVLSVALARLEEFFVPPETTMTAAQVLLSAPDTMVSSICFLRYHVKAARNALHTGNKAAVAPKLARALARGNNVYAATAISSAPYTAHSEPYDQPDAVPPLKVSMGTWMFVDVAEDTSTYACSALVGHSLKLEDSMTLPTNGLARICKLTTLHCLDVSNCGWITQDSARHVSNLVHLTALHMSGCGGLTAVPEGIGILAALRLLDASDCPALEHLPGSIGALSALQLLQLSSSRRLFQLPESMGDLRALQTLLLNRCNRLQQLPDSIGELRALQTLDLSDCNSLQELPDSIGTLRALQTLNLFWCFRLQELPDSIGKLSALQTLKLSCCYGLQKLPDSIGELCALQTLDLSRCEGLQELPDSIGKLRALQTLDLSHCDGLQELPDSISSLSVLHTLGLSHCYSLQELPDDIGKLSALQTLKLSRCDRLQKLPDSIGNLSALQTLDLQVCYALQTLPGSIGLLPDLREIDLSHCTSLRELPGSITSLRSLDMLCLFGCTSLVKLPADTSALTSLKCLDLIDCSSLAALPKGVAGWRCVHR